jgi:hypothetical protein
MNTTVNPDTVLQNIIELIFSPLYQLVTVSAFIYFLYGVVKFIADMQDPEKKNTGKAHMMYGLLGLFIILSVGAILRLFNDIFGSLFGQ